MNPKTQDFERKKSDLGYQSEKTKTKKSQELFDELSLQLMDEENEPVDARQTIMSAMTRAESMSQAAF